MKRRDDFTLKTIHDLSRGVAMRCSNPDCRVPTTAAKTGEAGVSSIGVAAHIHAAAPGGPRYLDSMTPAERAGASNGIWLCSGCSTKIDRDVLAHPPALLQDWKHRAETAARAEIGRPLPSENDGVQLLQAVMGGLPNSLSPLSKVHQAVRSFLEEKDPRFAVSTEFRSDRPYVTLQALQAVELSISVPTEHAAAWCAGLRDVVVSGRSATLPMKGVRVTGSKLMEWIAEQTQQGAVMLAPREHLAEITLTAPTWNDASILALTVHGAVTCGSAVMRFQGEALGGLCRLTMEVPVAVDEGGALQCTLDISIAYDHWKGRDVREIGHLDKFLRLMQAFVHQSECMAIGLEADGFSLLSARGPLQGSQEWLKNHLRFAHYVKAARSIARMKNECICVALGLSISSKKLEDVLRTAEMVEGRSVIGASQLTATPTVTVRVAEEGRPILDRFDVGGRLTIRTPPRTIEVFRQQVELPSSAQTMDAAQVVVQRRSWDGNLEVVRCAVHLVPGSAIEERFEV